MKFFFLAIPHSERDSLWEYLQNYCHPDARIVMSWETTKWSHKETNGEHFHIAIDMSDNQYQAFKKTIILKQYKLCGRAKDGVGRQYGLIDEKKVRDETKFLTYTVKSNNYASRNMDIQELQDMYSQSYIKDDEKQLDNLVMEYIDNNIICPTEKGNINTEKIEILILLFYMDMGKHISKSRLKTLLIKYCMCHLENRQKYMIEILGIIKY